MNMVSVNKKHDEVLKKKDERLLDENRTARASTSSAAAEAAAAESQERRLSQNNDKNAPSLDTTRGDACSTHSGYQAHSRSHNNHGHSPSHSNKNTTVTTLEMPIPNHDGHDDVPPPQSTSVNGHRQGKKVGSSKRKHSSSTSTSTSTSPTKNTNTNTSPSNGKRKEVRKNSMAHSKLSARSVAGRLALTSSSSSSSSKVPVLPRPKHVPVMPVLPPFLRKQKQGPEMAADRSHSPCQQLQHTTLSRLIRDQNQRMQGLSSKKKKIDHQYYLQQMNILRMKQLQQAPSTNNTTTHLEEQAPLPPAASINLTAYQKALLDDANATLLSTAQARAQAQAQSPYANVNVIRPLSPPPPATTATTPSPLPLPLPIPLPTPQPQTKVDPAAVAAAYFFLQQQQEQEELEHRQRLEQVQIQQQQHRENMKRRRTINEALLSLVASASASTSSTHTHTHTPSSSYPAGATNSADAGTGVGIGTMEDILTGRSYAAAARMQQQEELLARYTQASTAVGGYRSQSQVPSQSQVLRHPYDLLRMAANRPNVQKLDLDLDQPHTNIGIDLGESAAFPSSRNPLLQQQQHTVPPLPVAPSAMTHPLLIPGLRTGSGPLNSIRQSPYDKLKNINRQENKNTVMTLKTESDVIWLSKFLCFLRAECCEVHKATVQDVKERRKSKQVKINQVGIRCRFCAHLPHNERAGRSSCFPSSIDRIYQSVTMMIREHFSICEEFPPEIRQKYVNLKQHTKKGEMESKSHWKSAAEELGMVNLEQPMLGIFFREDLTPEQLELLNS